MPGEWGRFSEVVDSHWYPLVIVPQLTGHRVERIFAWELFFVLLLLIVPFLFFFRQQASMWRTRSRSLRWCRRFCCPSPPRSSWSSRRAATTSLSMPGSSLLSCLWWVQTVCCFWRCHVLLARILSFGPSLLLQPSFFSTVISNHSVCMCLSLCFLAPSQKLHFSANHAQTVHTLWGCLLGGGYVSCIFHMPGGIIVGDSGLCCCVPVQCLTSIVWAQSLPTVCWFIKYYPLSPWSLSYY